MIEIMSNPEGNIVAFRISETLTHSDYEEILIPHLELIIGKYGSARLLLDFGESFHGWEAEALWDDAKFGVRHYKDFEKLAVVGGPGWVEWTTKLASHLIPCEVEVFEPSQLSRAWTFIRQPLKEPSNK